MVHMSADLSPVLYVWPRCSGAEGESAGESRYSSRHVAGNWCGTDIVGCSSDQNIEARVQSGKSPLGPHCARRVRKINLSA